MLYRKFTSFIERFLKTESHKILLVNGARQVGKSYLIRYVGSRLFTNFVEINLKEDKEGARIFADVHSVDDFYLQLGVMAGMHLGTFEDTLVFLDEIQSYPHLMTILKFLNEDGKYRYIASGSELGVALSRTSSVPLGSIAIEQMYPLDFEEFLLAMGCGQSTIDGVREHFIEKKPLNDALHNYMLRQFKLYLIVGGMPDAVNKFIDTRNIVVVRNIQQDIYDLYKIDASQYDNENKLVIRKIFDMVPSNMENKKKRIVVKNIERTSSHKQFSDYADEFEYLINSGVVLSVQSISNPKFPLKESESKNLLKLYISDVGILTNILYKTNINAILGEENSVNLGSVYESVVAQELHAHGFDLHYYDNKKHGEVDYLIDDYTSLSILPIEVKSGKDYKIHSALDYFLSTAEYHVNNAIVFSNERDVFKENGVDYMPIYYVMFIKENNDEELIIPEIILPQEVE